MRMLLFHTVIEPKHTMYLNVTVVATLMPPAIIEPKHTMYLNFRGLVHLMP